jgi:folate-binding protein YgfZ
MTNTNTSLITVLPEWSFIKVTGQDAGPFLQNLLTNNILSLSIGNQHLSGFCSPKGRLLATFWVSHPEENSYFLWLSRDISLEFAKKLTMYRLRSKLEITQLDEQMSIFGQISTSSFETSTDIFCDLPPVLYNDIQYYRRLVAQTSTDTGASIQDQNLWSLLEVHSGIPRISDITKDLFVPQMINFESIGGVDFQKGCYPGQEIVARSQYLGSIKRRLKLAYLEVDTNTPFSVQAGMEIFSENDPEQPCGLVVLSSLNISNHRYYFQIELKISEISSHLYFLINPSKQSSYIHIFEPPYPLITI